MSKAVTSAGHWTSVANQVRQALAHSDNYDFKVEQVGNVKELVRQKLTLVVEGFASNEGESCQELHSL